MNSVSQRLPVDLADFDDDVSHPNATRVQGSRQKNVGLGQFGPAMRLSAWMSGTPLGLHVVNVVRCRPDEQVVGVHAEPVVAPMAHAKSMWDCPDEQLEREAMSEPPLSPVTRIPIPTRSRPSPCPTAIRNRHLAHESSAGDLHVEPSVSPPRFPGSVHGSIVTPCMLEST
jgi:hypothetical protein